MSKQVSPHFFRRDRDGSVRVRLRFTPEEAAAIEEAAGDQPLMPYIYDAIKKVALDDATDARRKLTEQTPAPREASA
jgi:uncharacterized membrane protein YkgB